MKITIYIPDDWGDLSTSEKDADIAMITKNVENFVRDNCKTDAIILTNKELHLLKDDKSFWDAMNARDCEEFKNTVQNLLDNWNENQNKSIKHGKD